MDVLIYAELFGIN